MPSLILNLYIHQKCKKMQISWERNILSSNNKVHWLYINPLSANVTKWSNTLKNLSAVADELFECVWSFCGVGALRVMSQEKYSFQAEVTIKGEMLYFLFGLSFKA